MGISITDYEIVERAGDGVVVEYRTDGGSITVRYANLYAVLNSTCKWLPEEITYNLERHKGTIKGAVDLSNNFGLVVHSGGKHVAGQVLEALKHFALSDKRDEYCMFFASYKGDMLTDFQVDE